NVAKNVATNLVNNNTNVRLGLTAFNTDQGGRILQSCNTGNSTALNTSIAGLTASTWTPLGEALYEVTRYFRGITGYFNSGTYVSPIQYRCQKNFVIVITDGYPTQDTDFPTNDPADIANTGASLPNWDGLAPATTAAQYPNFPVHSDGFKPSGATTDEGHTLYLDDIAKFGYDIDMRTTGNDATGVSFNDPKFLKQNMVTYTVGFAVANQMLADAANYGTGTYYQAGNEAELTAALQAALADIAGKTGSAAAVATNSKRLSSDTFIFQARFTPTDWSGTLLAYPIGTGGTIGVLNETTEVPELDGKLGWNAAKVMPSATSRNIYTYNPGSGLGIAFNWASLTSAQQAELNKNTAGTPDGKGQQRLAYLRGDQSNEAPAAMGFRSRDSILGDIANSDPNYVADQNYGFEVLPGGEGSGYKAYRTGVAKNRPKMVYAAANDGMLHGFDAATGVERFAFMPNAVFPELTFLTDTSYNANHRLINDGSPRVLDAYFDSAWKTILVGTLGGGGKGVYALNVTDPAGFNASKVLWEFTSANDSNMGVAVPQATIARMYNGGWVAIVPNGYNSGGNAELFILNLKTGAIIKEIDTGAGTDNGLSEATPVDVDGDRITDYIYAGDLRGNMWKFDVTSSDTANWKVAFTGAPLYTACSADPCTTSNRQPITARPEVGLNPAAGYFVYFGTGRYFAVGDNGVGTGANTVYAIRDKNTKGTSSPVLPAAGRSTLVQQTVLYEQVRSFGEHTEAIRVTSNNPITDVKNGWYLNLPASGERQVSSPLLLNGRLIFTTTIPSGDACAAGGDSWLMEIDALSGSRLTESPFDLNRDRSFDVQDFAPLNPADANSQMVPTSGRKGLYGIMNGLSILEEDGIQYKYGSGSTGTIDTTVESVGDERGRQSWREIQ
ncbi:MAG: PilC/PilY family type IV pilus protein, partial [Gammaproteobacteria bacterium]